MGLEGMVSKRADRPYRAGRSKVWIKVKNRNHPAMDRVMDSFRRRAACWNCRTG
jgi:ATP-dependent DNA ligase